MSADVAIKVRGLKTAYGTHVVHENLDLDVQRGEVMGVIGPSGCGKSVLLRAITGLKEPSAGEVHVFGQDVIHLQSEDITALQRLWGIMFQDGALFFQPDRARKRHGADEGTYKSRATFDETARRSKDSDVGTGDLGRPEIPI